MARRPDNKTRAEVRTVKKVVEQGSASTHFANHQFVAVDSLLRLLSDKGSTLLAWAVIGIALSLPLTLVLLLQNVATLGAGWDQTNSISVFMQEREDGALQLFVAQLEAREDVAGVELITPQEALAEFEENSGFGEALQGLDENPLPPVIVITPATTDAATLTDLQNYLQAQPGVDVAQLDLQWLQRLNAILALAIRLTWLLASLMGAGVILVIGNTIRLAIENRRAEIVVVKLVGGTDSYVARPFLYTGLWYGVGGGLLGVVLVQSGLWILSGPLQQLFGSYQSGYAVSGLGISGSFFVLVAAGFLGWLGAAISVVRHLRAIEPR